MAHTVLQAHLNANEPKEWLQVIVDKWPISDVGLEQMAKLFEFFAAALERHYKTA